jgi:hypothetical protein
MSESTAEIAARLRAKYAPTPTIPLSTGFYVPNIKSGETASSLFMYLAT